MLISRDPRTLDPADFKSQGQSGPEPNIDKKAPNHFEVSLPFSSAMEGVCSAQVQAQNKHSRGQIKDRPQFASGLCRQKADKRVRNAHKEVNAMMNSEHHHDHTDPPSELALRVRALESLLVDKGLVDPAAIDALIDTYEIRVGPRNGAKVVARAWSDPAFKQWLLEDATAAIGSMGYSGRQGEHMQVVENTPKIHNLVVCTLCSCYPWPVLGLPPVWY